jgi:hypothetical protein
MAFLARIKVLERDVKALTEKVESLEALVKSRKPVGRPKTSDARRTEASISN